MCWKTKATFNPESNNDRLLRFSILFENETQYFNDLCLFSL